MSIVGYGQLANRVPSNFKCNRCLNYAQSSSTCSIGLNPVSCGDGSSPGTGYAPVDSTGPDPVLSDLHATPARAPAVAAPEKAVSMATSHLGDNSELLALSQQVHNDLKKSACTDCRLHDPRYVSMNIYTNNQFVRCTCQKVTAEDVAKSVHKSLDNADRKRISVQDLVSLIDETKLA